ncbi:MAG: type II secretion system protein [Hahellaceae bacterium]|nr:type II secretion system protein [Hahellaceae bacterium]
MKTEKGFTLIESLVSVALLILALNLPVNAEGLPDSSGKAVYLHLADSLRANYAAWAFAMSLPDA